MWTTCADKLTKREGEPMLWSAAVVTRAITQDYLLDHIVSWPPSHQSSQPIWWITSRRLPQGLQIVFLKFFESTVRCTANGTEELIGPTNYFLSRQSFDMKPLPSGNTPPATMVLLWTPSLPNLFTLVLWCKRIWILNISSALKVSSSSVGIWW